MNVRFLSGAALFLILLPLPGHGQNVAIDENSFRIYLEGEEKGRESFSIRQIGPAAQQQMILRGTVDLDLPEGQVTLAPAMEVRGPDFGVSDYQIKISGAETTDITVRVSGNRFLERIVASSGERLREFRAGPGSILLDQGIVHHYYLLNPFLPETGAVSLTVLIPRTTRQIRMTLSFVGEEEVRVGGLLVSDARRYHLEGGDHPRDIWIDTQGRVLRLEIPSLSFVAERENLT
jgi:hypothetical protein